MHDVRKCRDNKLHRKQQVAKDKKYARLLAAKDVKHAKLQVAKDEEYSQFIARKDITMLFSMILRSNIALVFANSRFCTHRSSSKRMKQ